CRRRPVLCHALGRLHGELLTPEEVWVTEKDAQAEPTCTHWRSSPFAAETTWNGGTCKADTGGSRGSAMRHSWRGWPGSPPREIDLALEVRDVQRGGGEPVGVDEHQAYRRVGEEQLRHHERRRGVRGEGHRFQAGQLPLELGDVERHLPGDGQPGAAQ